MKDRNQLILDNVRASAREAAHAFNDGEAGRALLILVACTTDHPGFDEVIAREFSRVVGEEG